MTTIKPYNNLNQKEFSYTLFTSLLPFSQTAFRNTANSHRYTHLPRTSRVSVNPRISVGGPFGEVLKKTGAANELPFGYSTKYRDDETRVLYYGYRYNQSSVGRWLSRDPVGEQGGINLYGFVRNRPVDSFDYLGKCCACPDSITIENITTINGPFPINGPIIGHPVFSGLWWGHSFEVKVCLTYYCSISSAPPSLQWLERASRPIQGVTANKWTDMFAAKPSSLSATQWNNRVEPPCGSQICFRIQDIPAIAQSSLNTEPQYLNFIISIIGSCSTCNPKVRTVTANQELYLNPDGTPDSSSFSWSTTP